MKRSTFPILIAGWVGVAMLLNLALASPAKLQGPVTPEPSETRPRPTPAPYLELNPVQGPAREVTRVTATGGLWQPGQPVSLYWDSTGMLLRTTTVDAEGHFETTFDTPTAMPYGAVGQHTVLAVQGSHQAEATFTLLEPTVGPTDTDTPVPPPTNTYTPKPPTLTPTTTLTPTPSPTLRPVTPMVTITPFPPTKPPPGPARTNTPAPTRTNTPIPGTPTASLTPSRTPTPSQTPGPGTPSVTPLPAQMATATPAQEISETGSGWGTLFLWGFVLAGLLLVFRLLRVRGLPREG